MSYQNNEFYLDDDEQSGLLEEKNSNEQLQQKNYSFQKWKTLILLGFFVFISFLVVSSSVTNRSSNTTNTTKLLKEIKTSKTSYSQFSDDQKQSLFKEFKTKFNKEYASAIEEQQKYENFKTFLALIDERNDKELLNKGSAVHGITKFADLSHTEFKNHYLGYKPKSTKPSASYAISSVKSTIEAEHPVSSQLAVVDWSGIYTTAVKDQGYCGSCWAFSATEQIESDAIRANIISNSDALSVQQIVSCDKIDYGCDGGNTETAYDYVIAAGGLTTSSNYPYTSYYDVTGLCLYGDTITKEVSVDRYYSLVLNDAEATETNMMAYVVSTGPISVCLDAEDWSSYTSGIVSSCGKDVDHCVQAVGVNVPGGYWKIRNSWGTSWGDDGYIYLEYGSDTCYITYDPSVVGVAKR
eukprot:gene5639-7785_t